MSNDPTTTPGGEADMPGLVSKSARSRAAHLGEDIKEAAGKAVDEARSFMDPETRAETLSALTDKVNAVRDQMQQSADAARAWTLRQADAAREAASERPVAAISISAGAALAIGLFAGFCIGRATAEDNLLSLHN